MKILIIDDDHVIRVMLRGILSGCADLEVEEVSSGTAAWERFQQPQPPDLCILDNMMSDVTGLDLLQRIRSSPPAGQPPDHLLLVLLGQGDDCFRRPRARRPFYRQTLQPRDGLGQGSAHAGRIVGQAQSRG